MPKNPLSNWNFDIKSSILTILVAPLLFYVLVTLRKFLQEWCRYVLEGIMYNATRVFKHSVAKGLTFKRYCRLRLGDHYKYLYVPSSLDVKLDVDMVFVPLTLEGQVTDGTNYNHENLLTLGNRIRIIGDPGSGKTSLVKKMYRDCLHKGEKDPSAVKLPVILELKNLDPPKKNKDLGGWLFLKLKADAEKSKVYKMSECFESYATNQGLLVLLDGLDEVATSNFGLIKKTIEGLSVKLGQMSENNCILITMRTQFHQQIKEQFRDSFGSAVFVNSFTPTDIYTFLSRWPFKDNREINIARIYKELTDLPTLREMCSNPLILSMYLAEDQAVGRIGAPESRTDFYKKVCEELIIKRRMQQTGPALAYTKLREQRERILGRLAYDHMLNLKEAANTLSLPEAYRVAREVTNCGDSDAVALINEIAKETGLITEEKPGQTFRFIHLTFCEFLSAFEAVDGQKDGWSRLITSHAKFSKLNEPQYASRLVEVVPFAAGLLPRIKRSDALSDVALLEDYDLVSRCFLETKLYDHAFWPIVVDRQKERILAVPQEKWDEGWLRNLHLFNVVIADCNHCSLHMQSIKTIDLQSFFTSLVKAQQESLIEIISIYAKKDAAAGFRLAEISNLDLLTQLPSVIIKNCDQAPFYALVKQAALGDLDRIRVWASLLTEAALESIVVAEWMKAEDAACDLIPVIQSLDQRKLWYKNSKGFRSFFTQCLSIAINYEESNFPLVNCIKEIPAPTSCRIYWSNVGWIYQVTFLVFSVYAIDFAVNLFAKNPPKGGVSVYTLIFFVFYGGIITAYRARSRTLQVYKHIMLFPDFLSWLSRIKTTRKSFRRPSELRYLNGRLSSAIIDLKILLDEMLKQRKERIESSS